MESSTASEPAAGRTAWARNLGAPVRDFLKAETGGSVALVVAALAALAWANSPWPGSYESVWTTQLAISLGDHSISHDLRGWVNEGLMTLFFLVIGLEARRELDLGELRERTRLGIPVMAALGGMAATVGIFLAFNAGGEGAGGWGVAMSTDTALALGALALVAPSWATRLRVFLLTVVVIDDLAAMLVIAFVYSSRISLPAVAVALGLFAVLALLRYAGRWRSPVAVLVSIGIWLAMSKSGIDPVVAGLAIGLVTSAYLPARGDLERATELTRSFREQPTPELAASARRSLVSTISPNERLQYLLHPWTSFVVVPLFALANAGIHVDGGLLEDAVGSPLTLGIVAAYVIGKPLGILGASRLGASRALGGARPTLTWPALAGTGVAAGVGFTLSLLIADLSFDGRLLTEAKVGVLATAVLSPLLAWAAFQALRRLPASMRARQLGRTAEALIDLADEVDPERDHVRGQGDATVTLIEYGDFECSYCGLAEANIRELLAAEGDDLRFVFRHLPLSDVHPNAQLAAEAAEAAAAQGAFWDMYDLLLTHQEELSARDIRGYADELQLDLDQFTQDLRQRRHAPRVAADVASADASGVTGTPTFFVNGRRHQGVYDVRALSSAVRGARVRAAATVPATQAL
jgi:Na+/H+ antiporter NhaA